MSEVSRGSLSASASGVSPEPRSGDSAAAVESPSPVLTGRRVWRWRVAVIMLVLLAVVLVGTVLPLGVGSRVFHSSAGNMAPTVETGDSVYVNLNAYRFGALPARGEMIIFETGEVPAIETRDGRSTIFLKRVVALPGETIAIVGGKVMVNGAVAAELEGLSYVPMSVPGGNLPDEGATFTVPAECVYVLGDNTRNSYDSRFWGAVPLKALRGRAVGCVWPVGRVRWF